MNESRKETVTCMGKKEGGGRVYEVMKKEIIKAMEYQMCEKASGIDRIIAEWQRSFM